MSPPGDEWVSKPIVYSPKKKLSHQFNIVNSTGERIRILGKRTSCGCTVANLENTFLEPGGTCELKMDISLQPFHEKKRVTCTILTDHKQFPEWAYSVDYEVFPQVSFDPPQIDLGTEEFGRPHDSKPVAPPKAAGRTVWMEQYSLVNRKGPTDPAPLVVPESLRVDLRQSPIVDEPVAGIRRTRHSLQVRLAGDASAAGSFAQEIQVRTSDQPASSLRVTWRAESPISVAPSLVHFGMVKPGGPVVKRTLVVRSRDEASFRILATESGSPAVQLTSRESAGSHSDAKASHQLELQLFVPADAKDAVLSGTFSIRTDLAGAAEARVPWSFFLHH